MPRGLHARVDTNAEDVSRALKFLFRDQIPFALARAIVWTSLDFQEAQVEHMERIFEVRSKRFIRFGVKISKFASKRDDPIEGVVEIDPPGSDTADILTKFEADTIKLPTRGARLAVPIDAPRTGTGRLRGARSAGGPIGRFDFERVGSSNVYKGKRRTFLIEEGQTRGGVFQRVGRGSSSQIRTLFLFTPRVPIEPELDFRENAAKTIQEEFRDNFRRAFDRAVFTARPR